jgi:hypothetical protein
MAWESEKWYLLLAEQKRMWQRGCCGEGPGRQAFLLEIESQGVIQVAEGAAECHLAAPFGVCACAKRLHAHIQPMLILKECAGLPSACMHISNPYQY